MKDHRTVDEILAEIDAVLPPETPEAAQERRERIERERKRKYLQSEATDA